jgi:transcriptional regulator with XRE-family HTH domain
MVLLVMSKSMQTKRRVKTKDSWRVGQNLERMRLAQGLSLSDAADRLGWSKISKVSGQNRVSYIERGVNGVKNMGLAKLAELAKAYDTTPSQILKGWKGDN